MGNGPDPPNRVLHTILVARFRAGSVQIGIERRLETRSSHPDSCVTLSSSRNTVSFSSLRATTLLPPSRCASTSFRDVKEIPFPSLAVIWRKGLTRHRAFFVPRIPAEEHDDLVAQ